MRKTAKYTAGVQQALVIGLRAIGSDHNSLYQALNEHGYIWDGSAWIAGTPPPKSKFGDGEPTGVISVRVSAHKAEIEARAENICQALQSTGMKLIKVSSPYANERKNTNFARVYIDCVLLETR